MCCARPQAVGAAGPAGGVPGVKESLTDEPLKEWMRLPKEMLANYCDKEKRVKPMYSQIRGTGQNGKAFLCRAILNDKKRTPDKALIYPSHIAAPSRVRAEHFAALCAMYNLTPVRPPQPRIVFTLNCWYWGIKFLGSWFHHLKGLCAKCTNILGCF